MLHSTHLWPAHPHPLPNECLTSWIVRCAHANGLKVQPFSDIVFGKEFQILNRDIDRNAPKWLIDIMSAHTGTNPKTGHKTTMQLYKGRLFPILHAASQLRWITPVKHFHRTLKGYAMQYCPMCLFEDEIPYYRLSWRVALYTYCPKHLCMMRDRCPHCSNSVAFHRIEQGKPNVYIAENLDQCWNCEAPLSQSPLESVILWNEPLYRQWSTVLNVIERQYSASGPINYNRLNLLHQICRLLVSVRHAQDLESYILNKSGAPKSYQISSSRDFYEERSVEERHYINQLSWWLLGKDFQRIRAAIQNKALKVNELYKDNPEAKNWLLEHKVIEIKNNIAYLA